MTRVLASTLLVLLVACARSAEAPAEPVSAPAPAPRAAGLAGTAWRLVEIQSMDDRVFVPDDRDKYTLAFETGGKLTVRADCNRGSGTWEREGPSGLRFGPLALTRMACPPGSIEQRFASDLGYVRSFVEKDGHIFLATQADGAILEFEPLAPATAPTFDCGRADGTVEQTICADAGLAELDVRLDALYRRALETFAPAEIDGLKAFQRGWIKGRNECWKADDLRACVRESYEIRITELQVRTGALVVPPAVSFACDDGEALTAVFYSDTVLPVAVLTRGTDDQALAYQQPTASGSKYEGRNVSFWSKGAEARVSWNGRELTCREAPK